MTSPTRSAHAATRMSTGAGLPQCRHRPRCTPPTSSTSRRPRRTAGMTEPPVPQQYFLHSSYRRRRLWRSGLGTPTRRRGGEQRRDVRVKRRRVARDGGGARRDGLGELRHVHLRRLKASAGVQTDRAVRTAGMRRSGGGDGRRGGVRGGPPPCPVPRSGFFKETLQ